MFIFPDLGDAFRFEAVVDYNQCLPIIIGVCQNTAGTDEDINVIHVELPAFQNFFKIECFCNFFQITMLLC